MSKTFYQESSEAFLNFTLGESGVVRDSG